MSIPQLDNTPRCQHVRLSGRQCKAPAKRGTNYCLFHEAEHTNSIDLSFPPVEDAARVAVATAQIIDAIKCDLIDYRRAALLFAGLRIARANLKQLGLELGDEIVPAPAKQEEDPPSLAQYLLERLNVDKAKWAREAGRPAPEPIDVKQAIASGEDLGELLLERLQDRAVPEASAKECCEETSLTTKDTKEEGGTAGKVA